MTKSSYIENLSRPRLNEDTHSRINIIMVIDILSSINIAKYFEQQKPPIKIEENIYKNSKKNSNCKNVNCSSLNELVMLKELNRDDKLFDKIHMGILQDRTIIIDNGHITNLLYIRLSNKNMYKSYMREFKHRKHTGNYIAFVIKNGRQSKNDLENKLLKELKLVLKQAQIEIQIFDRNKFRTPTLLKKEIREKILYYFNKVEDTTATSR